ncbi:MAG: GTPase [Bacteroidia bacterium]|nr:GTPase [Bacteroidia bacterium]
MKLLFVYNVNSGLLDRLLDNAHKIVSPATYDCNLCTITYGSFTEDALWKAFRMNSGVEMEFYHKDEFKKKFASKWLPKFSFPAVLIPTNGELELFIPSELLNEMSSSEELIETIKKHLALH